MGNVIRQITESDIKTILIHAPSFWKEINGDILLGKLNLAGFSNFLYQGIKKNELIGWCGEKNNKIISGVLFRKEYAFFTGKNILSEIFWWTNPNERTSSIAYKLILTAEKYGRENDFDSIIMACMKYPRPERLTQFYEKIGYSSIQFNFLKNL